MVSKLGAVGAILLIAVYLVAQSINGVTGQSVDILYSDLTVDASDIIGEWSGTCSSTTYLRGDGTCAAPGGSGNISGTISTTGNVVTTDGSQTIQDSGVTVASMPHIVYSTGVTGKSMATSGTNSILVGPTTMTTPSSAGNYVITIEVAETAAGSGGTCSSGTIAISLSWQNADTSVTYPLTVSSNIFFMHPVNSSTLAGSMSMIATAPGLANDFVSSPFSFRAASGTAIQYQLYQVTNSNCTTAPVFAVRPVLTYLSN